MFSIYRVKAIVNKTHVTKKEINHLFKNGLYFSIKYFSLSLLKLVSSLFNLKNGIIKKRRNFLFCATVNMFVNRQSPCISTMVPVIVYS